MLIKRDDPMLMIGWGFPCCHLVFVLVGTLLFVPVHSYLYCWCSNFYSQLDYIHCWIDQCMLSKIKYRGFFNFNSFVNLTVYIAVIGLKFGPVSSRGNVHMNGSTCSEKSDAVIRMGSLSTMEALIKTLLNNV